MSHSSPHFNNLIATATDVFEGMTLFRQVPLPNPEKYIKKNLIPPTRRMPALWTTDGLRPRYDNIAAIAEPVKRDDLEQLKLIAQDLSIPLSLISLDDRYYFFYRDSGEFKEQFVTREKLKTELENKRKLLFTPRAIGSLRSGQLSFSDLEDAITKDSYTYLSRQRANLDTALKQAIHDAFKTELNILLHQNKTITNTSIFDSVLMVAIAYLAARILEDKGFFGPEQLPINDPKELLKNTINKTNGFFKEAFYKNLPLLSDETLQQIAKHLGVNITFALVDHRDVGHLYESALQNLNTSISNVLNNKTLKEKLYDTKLNLHFFNLQQHYTPIAIADRILNSLPLERLRPEERTIFDPAAGSGSLLLAATNRLANMSDIPKGEEQEQYLSTHVIGNDIDPLAGLITKLRYSLIQESLGPIKQFTSPRYIKEDYKKLIYSNLSPKPRVIVANPPFTIDKKIQKAAEFVELAINWLNNGDQFAFILPQTFLSGNYYGMKQAREIISKNCHIFETWQFPEGTIGLTARQAVCVVLGEKNNKQSTKSIARTIIAGSNIKETKDKGFLGQSWVTSIGNEAVDWSSAKMPEMPIFKSTIPLGNFYDVFGGVKLYRDIRPIPYIPVGIPFKHFWKFSWKELNRIWADPKRVNKEEKYILYGKEYLEGPRLKREQLFDSEKVLVASDINGGAKDPIGAHLDTIGLCPDTHTICIYPLDDSKIITSPVGWKQLSLDEKLLWLLGILNSEIARELSIQNRSPQHLETKALAKLPLPAVVNSEIITIIKLMVERDINREPIPEPDPLRQELNRLVELSYGSPNRISINRTGESPALAAWQKERQKNTVTATGCVLEVNKDKQEILLYLNRLLDEETEAWIPLPQELPGWALEGTVFEVQISKDVKTFAELAQRPWALKHFKHTPRPYISLEELEKEFENSLG